MNTEKIIAAAVEELDRQSFGVTQQFLAVHKVLYENGKPKVQRIDLEKSDGTAVVYFPVLDEKFYLAVYVDTQPEIAFRWLNTESFNRVYFSATSEQLSYSELCSFTTLKPTDGWSKGESMKHGNRSYKFSRVSFEPNTEADKFEDKLAKLLDYLETDSIGVKRLADEANGGINVAMYFHDGNGMFGGPTLSKNIIHRMSKLNLDIDFDLYASGNRFED